MINCYICDLILYVGFKGVTSDVLCDKKVPLKFKGKLYRTTIRPAMFYGTKYWTVKNQHENQVNVAEMRMLCWMSG